MWKYNNEIKHYGKIGMHWGVKKYRSKTGVLTPIGKSRQKKITLQDVDDLNIRKTKAVHTVAISSLLGSGLGVVASGAMLAGAFPIAAGLSFIGGTAATAGTLVGAAKYLVAGKQYLDIGK